jgi:hypothetical protein
MGAAYMASSHDASEMENASPRQRDCQLKTLVFLKNTPDRFFCPSPFSAPSINHLLLSFFTLTDWVLRVKGCSNATLESDGLPATLIVSI